MTATLAMVAAALEDIPGHPEAPCYVQGPALWTSDAKRDRQRAAALCHSEECPILAACRAGAAERLERHGVWGGVDVETLYRDRYRNRPAAPKRRHPCGTYNAYRAHKRKHETVDAACRAANSAYQAEAKRRRRALRLGSQVATAERCRRAVPTRSH